MKTISFILLLFLSTGCSDDDVIDRLKLLRMAQKVDPNVKPIIAESLQSGVRCKTESGRLIYGPGCTGAFKVKVDILDVTVLEFDSPENAKKEASRLGQYYFKNWVFDEVTGEPVLEKFVKKAFDAKKAKKAN